MAGGTDIAGATGSSYTLTYSEQGQTVQVRVAFTDDANNDETLTSEVTGAVTPRPNRSATGAPSIQGILEDGQILSADTAGIADADGLDDATFAYQWMRVSGGGAADITGQTSSTYTLRADDVGKSVQVKVAFTDDRGAAEATASAHTGPVAESGATRKLLWVATMSPQDGKFDAGKAKGSLSPSRFTAGGDTPQVVHLGAALPDTATLALELTGLPITKDLSGWRLRLHGAELAFGDATVTQTGGNPAAHRFPVGHHRPGGRSQQPLGRRPDLHRWPAGGTQPAGCRNPDRIRHTPGGRDPDGHPGDRNRP